MKCNPSRLFLLAAGLVSFTFLAQPVSAVQIVYVGRDNNTSAMTSFPNSQAAFAQFTASLATFGVDTIESIPNFSFNPSLTFGGTGIAATTQGTLAADPPFNGLTIDNQALAELDAAAMFDPNFPPVPTSDTLFTFNQPITAFGAYFIQGGDNLNNNPITIRLRNTVNNTFVDAPTVPLGPGLSFDNVVFIGVTDTLPFNEVQIIEAVDQNDGMLYDNIVAGQVVPEPGSVMLLIFGGAFALCRNRGVGRS
jgi:hypothetical protein